MKCKNVALLVYLAAGVLFVQAYEGNRNRKIRSFGVDENFGNSLETNGEGFKGNQQQCASTCNYRSDCCAGQKCKKYWPGSKYGYCAKECLPAQPGESCKRCLVCTSGFTCTVFLPRGTAEEAYLCVRMRESKSKNV